MHLPFAKAWREWMFLVNNAGLALGPPSLWSRLQTGWPWFRPILSAWPYLTRKICPRWWNEMAILSIWASTAGTAPYPGANVWASKVCHTFSSIRADLAGKEDSCQQYWTWSLRRDRVLYSLWRRRKTGRGPHRAHAAQPEDIQHRSLVDPTVKHVNVNGIEIMPVSPQTLALNLFIVTKEKQTCSTWGWLFFMFPGIIEGSKEKDDSCLNYWFYSLWCDDSYLTVCRVAWDAHIDTSNGLWRLCL